MSHYLVTGGAGFIGSAIVDRLLAVGHEVTIIDALIPSAHGAEPEYVDPRVTFIRADLRRAGPLAEALKGVDGVSHQAGLVGLGVDMHDAPAYAQHNDLGTARLLQALARVGFAGPLVLASSMVVYGEGRYRCLNHGEVRPPARSVADLDAGQFEPRCPTCAMTLAPEAIDEDAALDPRTLYAATKLHQEHLCRVYARETDVPLTILRYHNVYGPRMPRDTPYAGVASLFRSALENGEAPDVFEDGEQLRDFVHVSDVAHANVIALTEADAPPGTYNIASGHPRTIAEMAHALWGAFGEDGDLRPSTSGRYRVGDVRHVFASVERARATLGFEPAVHFEDGVRDFAVAPLRSPVGTP